MVPDPSLASATTEVAERTRPSCPLWDSGSRGRAAVGAQPSCPSPTTPPQQQQSFTRYNFIINTLVPVSTVTLVQYCNSHCYKYNLTPLMALNDEITCDCDRVTTTTVLWCPILTPPPSTCKFGGEDISVDLYILKIYFSLSQKPFNTLHDLGNKNITNKLESSKSP